MSTKLLKKALQLCIDKNLCFAIYSMPNCSDIKLIVATKETTIKSSDINKHSGFVIAPFYSPHKEYIILEPKYIYSNTLGESDFDQLNHIVKEDTPSTRINDLHTYISSFEEYKQQFKQLQESINNGSVQKAILSRVKAHSGIDKSILADFYFKLLNDNQKSYTFMYNTPSTGLWAGASPELLLQRDGNSGKTVALAGTLSNNNNTWSKKEINEQEHVNTYIKEIFNKFEIDNYKQTETKTIDTGSVKHLKTEYSFKIDKLNTLLPEFIEELYPTPALCGAPKKNAMDIIINTEKHDRLCYGGFVGTINKTSCELFVNIRCMNHVNSTALLYLGGGITAQSDVDKEWTETENKAKTIEKHLDINA